MKKNPLKLIELQQKLFDIYCKIEIHFFIFEKMDASRRRNIYSCINF